MGWFQEKTGAQPVFQLVMDLPYVDTDCFATDKPTIVPVESLIMDNNYIGHCCSI